MATQSWLSAVRISPEQKRHKGGKIDRDSENKRKKKKRNEQTNKTGCSRAAVGQQDMSKKKSDVRDR